MVTAKRLLFPEVGQVMWESFTPHTNPYTVEASTTTSLISVGTELAISSNIRNMALSLFDELMTRSSFVDFA